jgi:hypothetical protein
VPYRPVPDLRPPTEADIDTPEMAVASAFVGYAEENLSALTRLRDTLMDLVLAQSDHATSRLAAAARDGATFDKSDEPAAGIDKMAQSVRRTVALQMKLAADLKIHGSGLAVERAARREQRAQDHKTAVDEEIDLALTDAFTEMYGDGDDETDAGDKLCCEMLADREDLLRDLDEFKDYLDRPVGETVAALCVALGLAADTCVKDGDTWVLKRPPSAYAQFLEARDARAQRAAVTIAAAQPP